MKKKKNSSRKSSNSGESFPVDTLGIPILVDVIASSEASDAEDEIEILAEPVETGANPADPPVSGMKITTDFELPTEAQLDQVTDRIARSVTGEILAALEPLVRHKVNRALRLYKDELVNLPEEGSEKNPESE